MSSKTRPPSNFSATGAVNKINLSWSPINEANDYIIFYRVAGTRNRYTNIVVKSPNTSVSIPVQSGIQYEFDILTRSSRTLPSDLYSIYFGRPQPKAIAVAPNLPSPPRNFRGTTEIVNMVNLAWEPPISTSDLNIIEYIIYFRVAGSVAPESALVVQPSKLSQYIYCEPGPSPITYEFDVGVRTSAGITRYAINGVPKIQATPSVAPRPGIPTNFTATSELPGVKLTWNAPSTIDQNYPIVDYAIFYRVAGSSETEKYIIVPANQTSVEIRSFDYTTLFEFDILSRSGAGASFRYSTLNTKPTAEPKTCRGYPPSAPRNLTATPSINGVQLSWDRPICLGSGEDSSIQTLYDVIYREAGAKSWMRLRGDTNRLALSRFVPLTLNKNYEFDVLAWNRFDGYGELWSVNNSVVSATPIIVQRPSFGNILPSFYVEPILGGAQVSWNPPITPPNYPVLEYRLWATSTDNSEGASITLPGNQYGATLTLPIGKTYRFFLSARNAGGTLIFYDYPGSPPQPTCAPLIPLNAPTNLVVNNSKNETIRLSWNWTPPATRLQNIPEFKIYCKNVDAPAEQEYTFYASVPITQKSIELVGLLNIPYRFMVKVSNRQQSILVESEPSISNAITPNPSNLGNPVSDVKWQPADSSVLLMWSHTGLQPIYYDIFTRETPDSDNNGIYRKKTSVQFDSQSSSSYYLLTIGGLTNNISYDYSIVPVYANGIGKSNRNLINIMPQSLFNRSSLIPGSQVTTLNAFMGSSINFWNKLIAYDPEVYSILRTTNGWNGITCNSITRITDPNVFWAAACTTIGFNFVREDESSGFATTSFDLYINLAKGAINTTLLTHELGHALGFGANGTNIWNSDDMLICDNDCPFLSGDGKQQFPVAVELYNKYNEYVKSSYRSPKTMIPLLGGTNAGHPSANEPGAFASHWASKNQTCNGETYQGLYQDIMAYPLGWNITPATIGVLADMGWKIISNNKELYGDIIHANAMEPQLMVTTTRSNGPRIELFDNPKIYDAPSSGLCKVSTKIVGTIYL